MLVELAELSKDRQAIREAGAADSAALQAKYSHLEIRPQPSRARRRLFSDCLSLKGAVIDSRSKKVKSKTNPTPIPVSVELKFLIGRSEGRERRRRQASVLGSADAEH